LQEGYTVLASWMPFLGENAFQDPFQIGDCTIDPMQGNHDEFACAESDKFSPLTYFMEPIATGLNYALSQASFTDVVMVGLSGGGWTTTMYAALDPRVRVSVPVAGTLPLFLRTTPYDPDIGDWEQSGSAIYGLIDYLDLYVLGAYGA